MTAQFAYPPLPRFRSGQLLITPAARNACTPAYICSCLARHVRGDWGIIGGYDCAQNELAVRQSAGILSAYPLDPSKPAQGFGDNCLWIITQADRSATTFLLPGEY